MNSEEELLIVFEDPTHINAFVDTFRRGRPLNDLLTLINSNNLAVVQMGLIIAGEINFPPAEVEAVVLALRKLLGHDDGTIRLYSLLALYPFLQLGDKGARQLLRKLSADIDPDVQSMACSILSGTAPI